MVKRCVQTGLQQDPRSISVTLPSPAAGWMQKLGPPQRANPHSCLLLTLLTIQVVAPPGSVPRGQAALWQAHLLGRPTSRVSSRVFSTSGSCKGLRSGDSFRSEPREARSSGELRKALKGTWEDVTQPGEALSSLERGHVSTAGLQGGPLQLGGCIRATGEPSKVWNWGREGGTSCEAGGSWSTCICRPCLPRL